MKLSEYVTFKNGKKKPFENGEYPIYGGNGILGFTNQYNSCSNSIIIGRVGAYCGCVYKEDDKCWISDNAIVGYVKEGTDYNFMYYYLKAYNLNRLHIGSGHPLMTQDILNNIDVNIPNYDYQVKAGLVLKKLDDKIKLNTETNNNLYELVRNYYIELVNKSDKECSLSELMEYQGGSQPPASQFEYEKNENNIRFVQIRDFDSDSHICYIPNSNKNKLCSKKDILIARYGASLGRICYGLDGAYNVALAKVLPLKEEYREMLRVILESKDFYNYINQVGQRSAQAGFNAGDISGYTIKIPDENDIIEFNKLADIVIDKRMLLKEENEKLSQLRDTLLPKLMNGEIDLDNIEI